VKSAQEPFRHFGYRDFKGQRGHSSTASGIPETRNTKCKSAQEPFRHFGYRDFKGQRGRSSTASGIPETRNAKCKSAREPFQHFGYRDFKGQRVALFHCISKPRNAKCEKRPGAISTLRPLGLQRTQGLSLYVFSLDHPPWKKQLMNIEQVVETSAQAMNAGHGGSGRQSAQDHPVCRFS
jgi:hypothetical protein